MPSIILIVVFLFNICLVDNINFSLTTDQKIPIQEAILTSKLELDIPIFIKPTKKKLPKRSNSYSCPNHKFKAIRVSRGGYKYT